MSSNGIHKDQVSILIIDDEEDIREIFEEILKRSGYLNISTVGTGKEAIESFSNGFVNVAMIDLNLPDINGLDLIPQLRSLNPDTEFVIVTGFASIDSAIQSLYFEVGGFLEKPISSDKLLRTIDEVIFKQNLKLQNQRFLHDIEIANKEIRFLNDLLVNNVDGLNQSLLLTMVQIEKLSPTPEQEKVLNLFQEAIRKNARLTRNIKKLQTIQQHDITKEFESIDLTRVVNNAINRLKEDYRNMNFECICDLSIPRNVLADNNITHLILEIFLLAIFNDPSPKIKMKIEFEKIEKEGLHYWKLFIHSFLARLIFEQRDIKHPSDLQISITDQSFQDLGPYIVNELIRFYNGFVDVPDKDEKLNNFLEIYLPCVDEK